MKQVVAAWENSKIDSSWLQKSELDFFDFVGQSDTIGISLCIETLKLRSQSNQSEEKHLVLDEGTVGSLLVYEGV